MKLISLFFPILILNCIQCITVKEEESLSKLLTQAEQNSTSRTVEEDWLYMEQKVKEFAKQATNKILPYLIENSPKMNLSQECMRNTMHLITGIKNIKGWAIRFLDASAKSIDGILDGSLQSFGAFEECLDSEVKSTRSRDKGKLMFRGQYCTVDLKFPLGPKPAHLNMFSTLPVLENITKSDTIFGDLARMAEFLHFFTLRLGLCTPSSCSFEDLNKLTTFISNSISPVNVSVSRCELKQEMQFTPLVIFVICFFSFAGCLMAIGTSIDVYAYYYKQGYKNKFIRALMAFSILTNCKKFLNTNSTSESFTCLNGIRFISVTWIIVVHTYTTLNFQMFQGTMDIKQMIQDFAIQPILNSCTVVDTFFCIAGFLLSYLVVKDVMLKGRKFNVVLYIVHRLWRILPVYASVILFTFLLNLFGSGPVWHDTVNTRIENCYTNWWTNLLFINNLYDAEHMCNYQTWYLAADFQMYVGALLIILPMIRWPKAGILLSIFAICISIIYAGTKTYVESLPPTMIVAHLDPEFMVYYWANYYFTTYVHIGAYCVGILAGYFLATNPNLKISPAVQVVGWCLAFVTNFTIVYCTVIWNRGVEPSIWSSVFFAAFSKTVWAVGIAWVILCCVTGHGGLINRFLSWKVFVPLGRLTFVAYIVHPIVQLVVIGSIKTQLQFDHFLIVWLNFGHVCATYGIAFIGSMLIEAPFISLEKILLPRGKKPHGEKEIEKEKNDMNLNESFNPEKNKMPLP